MIPTELIGSSNGALVETVRKIVQEELKEQNNG